MDPQECEEVTDSRPLRQGDLFVWIQGRSPSTALGFGGILVTADCDFAQSKHAGTLSYVPLLGLEDFVRFFILPKLLRRQLDQARTELVAVVHKAQAQAGNGRMDPEIVLQWIRKSAGTTIAQDLNLSPKDAATLHRLAELLSASEAALENEDFAGLATAYLGLRARTGKAVTNAWKDVLGAIHDAPGDAFFLSSILPDVNKNGCFAYLRIIREITPDHIAIRHRDTSNEAVRAMRVSRLASPYRYRLTQQMAEVFTAIGLPAPYDVRRKELIDALSPPEDR